MDSRHQPEFDKPYISIKSASGFPRRMADGEWRGRGLSRGGTTGSPGTHRDEAGPGWSIRVGVLSSRGPAPVPARDRSPPRASERRPTRSSSADSAVLPVRPRWAIAGGLGLRCPIGSRIRIYLASELYPFLRPVSLRALPVTVQ
jgi:hypothetical protein